MIFRVVLEVGYNEAWFEFGTIERAGEFVQMAIDHQVTSEDTKKKRSIKIEVVNPAIKEEED